MDDLLQPFRIRLAHVSDPTVPFYEFYCASIPSKEMVVWCEEEPYDIQSIWLEPKLKRVTLTVNKAFNERKAHKEHLAEVAAKKARFVAEHKREPEGDELANWTG